MKFGMPYADGISGKISLCARTRDAFSVSIALQSNLCRLIDSIEHSQENIGIELHWRRTIHRANSFTSVTSVFSCLRIGFSVQSAVTHSTYDKTRAFPSFLMENYFRKFVVLPTNRQPNQSFVRSKFTLGLKNSSGNIIPSTCTKSEVPDIKLLTDPSEFLCFCWILTHRNY